MTFVSVRWRRPTALRAPDRVAGVSMLPPAADEESESPDQPEQLRIRRQKYDRLHGTLSSGNGSAYSFTRADPRDSIQTSLRTSTLATRSASPGE